MPDNPYKDEYVVSGFKIVADIEGVGEVEDIVAISGTYGLNSIPTAVLTLACGINAQTGNEAFAHVIYENMPTRAKVTVTLEILTTDGKKEKSPAEKFVVFEGYAAGYGFQRAQDNAQYVLHLVHWLDDLNVGSMLSRDFFPGSPFNLAASANEVSAVTDHLGNAIILSTPVMDAVEEVINEASIREDFWGKALKPLFLSLAKMRGPQDDACSPPTNTERQTLIENAIKRMPGGKNKSTLQLDFNGLDNIEPTDFANAVTDFLATTAMSGYNYSTFWSTLVGQWAPSFLFAVSPGATFANVIPYYGALQFVENDPNFKTIEADDYSYANFMAQTSTILEGIDIFWSTASTTGVMPGQDTSKEPPNLCDPLGSYPPKDKRLHRGTTLLKEPPAWLASTVDAASTTSSAESSGAATAYPSDNIVTDGGNTTRAGGKKPTRDEARRRLKTSNVLSIFAEHWYKTELMQQRYGEMSGKLRFDIAPGSTVKIKAPTKTMPMLSDKLDMVASVAKVSFVINSESAQAGTSFTLTNIRSVREDKDELKTSPLPPLYAAGWAGGPLIEPQ